MYGQFPISSPPRAYIRRGYLTEGILRYEFVGLIRGGDYFWNFTVTCYISFRVLSRTEASLTFVIYFPTDATLQLLYTRAFLFQVVFNCFLTQCLNVKRFSLLRAYSQLLPTWSQKQRTLRYSTHFLVQLPFVNKKPDNLCTKIEINSRRMGLKHLFALMHQDGCPDLIRTRSTAHPSKGLICFHSKYW